MLTRRGLLLGSGAALATPTGLSAYMVGVEPMMANTTRYHLTPPGWPEDLRLRVVALADFHCCEPFMTAARVRDLALSANALQPDLIVLLGDYNGGHDVVTGIVEPAAWAEALSVLRAPLGTFAILGNHDWWHGPIPSMPGGPEPVRRALRDAGATVLENDLVRLTHGGRPFWLAGLADQVAYLPQRRWPMGADDLPGTLKRVTDDAPVLMLIHEPYLFAEIPDRVSLTLAGHTHGGQVLVPFMGAPFTARSHYLYGHMVERGRHLIISAGLGESGFPARLGRPPELVVVDLGGTPPAA